MTDRYLSVVEASLRSGFSQIQIWILIRNDLIKNINTLNQTKVELGSLRTWILNNSSLSLRFSMKVDDRNPRWSVKKRIEKQLTQSDRP